MGSVPTVHTKIKATSKVVREGRLYDQELMDDDNNMMTPLTAM